MKQIKIGDVIIITISVFIIVASLLLFRSVGGKPVLHVTSSSNTYVFDVSVDRIERFSGPVGTTTVEIKDHKVRVVDSDCRDKVCVAAGWIEKPGQWIICLPNDVFVLIEGKDEMEVDVDDTAF
ncbi:MAG: NusG domain II-containing protein [Sphaerochaetaceae bacterium]|jgi:hypothetical protein